VRCFELGAADYIPKPFALAELLARVRARLQGNGPHNGVTLLEAGRIKLDLQRRSADAGQGPVPVSGVVDVYIGRLRSKLGPFIIETVRNVGYCIHK
jgi:DNA-binding response OmpR family regulator